MTKTKKKCIVLTFHHNRDIMDLSESCFLLEMVYIMPSSFFLDGFQTIHCFSIGRKGDTAFIPDIVVDSRWKFCECVYVYFSPAVVTL